MKVTATSYFKAFTVKDDRIDGHVIAPFDGESINSTATAYDIVKAFESRRVQQGRGKDVRISVWRTPTCAQVWNDITLIGSES